MADAHDIHPLVLDALHGLKVRIDALEQEMRGLLAAPQASAPAAGPDMQAFARQLIEQIGAELNAMRPRDDGKTIGAMQDGVLHDGKGVVLARYQMPDRSILIWQRDDTGETTTGYTIKIAGSDGNAVAYARVL